MAQAQAGSTNYLINRLPAPDAEQLGLERLALPLRTMLHQPGLAAEYVYFIEQGFASVVSKNGDRAAEIGIVGRDGMTGVGILYGDLQSPFETFMQIEGAGLRCSVDRLRSALLVSPDLRSLLLAYAHAFSIQVATTASANGSSKLDERLARWLLMVSDRMGRTFHLTHEFMAVMLSSRRSGVTLAIQALEGRGLIRAGRGMISVVDRQGLIEATDGAYGVAEREFERLLR